MTEIAAKIVKLRKETMSKMDRLHILLLLSPNNELSKQLEYTEGVYLSMLELCEDNMDTTDSSIINRLTNDVETVNNLLNDLEDDLSKEFKLMPLLYLGKLKGEVLAYFYNKLADLLEEVGSLELLPKYINENTSEQIISFSKKLLDYIEKYASDHEKRLLPIKYLEEHTNKCEFNLKKWTEFEKNIAFTLKYINCPDEVQSELIKEAAWEFELYYFVMITLSE
ncbi:MAG: hypothetical protein IJX78_06870 [Bacilli bacterium]|nr:hypothetical protein [Bacilli bacterium]